MKKIAILTASILMCLSTFAQKDLSSIKYEGALTLFITQSEYNLLLQNHSFKLVNEYYSATHFCYIDNKLPEVVRNMGDLCDYVSEGNTCDDAQALISSKQIYYDKYRLERDEVRYTAYAIGSTGYYVIVYPMDVYHKGYQMIMKEYGF